MNRTLFPIKRVPHNDALSFGMVVSNKLQSFEGLNVNYRGKLTLRHDIHDSVYEPAVIMPAIS